MVHLDVIFVLEREGEAGTPLWGWWWLLRVASGSPVLACGFLFIVLSLYASGMTTFGVPGEYD